MDFEAIKRAAEGYRADMSRFLRDMIAIPSESCEEKGVVMRIKEEMEKLGYEVCPKAEEPRYDIIQTIAFGAPDPLRRFCEGIQSGAPVDSFVTPEPWAMPGYDDQVIMAAGAFVQGASIELSADAPMREPYVCYMQGGLTYSSGKAGILLAAERIKNQKH